MTAWLGVAFTLHVARDLEALAQRRWRVCSTQTVDESANSNAANSTGTAPVSMSSISENEETVDTNAGSRFRPLSHTDHVFDDPRNVLGSLADRLAVLSRIGVL